MRRTDKINDLLQHELSALINRHVPIVNYMITVVSVNCTDDLRWANVKISVLPDKFFGSALRELRRHSSLLNNELKKRLKLRLIPKINWLIDPTEKKAAELEEVFKEASIQDSELHYTEEEE